MFRREAGIERRVAPSDARRILAASRDRSRRYSPALPKFPDLAVSLQRAHEFAPRRTSRRPIRREHSLVAALVLEKLAGRVDINEPSRPPCCSRTTRPRQSSGSIAMVTTGSLAAEHRAGGAAIVHVEHRDGRVQGSAAEDRITARGPAVRRRSRVRPHVPAANAPRFLSKNAVSAAVRSEYAFNPSIARGSSSSKPAPMDGLMRW